MRIPKWAIEEAKYRGACKAAITWLSVEPRTFRQLAKRDVEWADWAVYTFLTPSAKKRVSERIDRIARQCPPTIGGNVRFEHEWRKLLVEALEKYFKGRKN